uniref:Bm14192, isoform b n=1 Tax=Brugia malayi TaxID=6279 RepID=A0A1I9G263_BRUMA|nr:Bm14192, isoform b [Brugia malayi]
MEVEASVMLGIFVFVNMDIWRSNLFRLILPLLFHSHRRIAKKDETSLYAINIKPEEKGSKE